MKPWLGPLDREHLVGDHGDPGVVLDHRELELVEGGALFEGLQNIEGKTLASAYSARATDYAGVSTPLTWEEVDRGVRREDFTIRTVPARVREMGDLWADMREHPGVDLRAMVDSQ